MRQIIQYILMFPMHQLCSELASSMVWPLLACSVSSMRVGGVVLEHKFWTAFVDHIDGTPLTSFRARIH